MIGGCGAIPAKTNELVLAMTRFGHRLTQIDCNKKELATDERRSTQIRRIKPAALRSV
jgi:hypothetical protein